MLGWQWMVLTWTSMALLASGAAWLWARRPSRQGARHAPSGAMLVAVAAFAWASPGCKNNEEQRPPLAPTTSVESAVANAAPSVAASRERAVAFLLASVATNGSLGDHPGATALALWAVATSSEKTLDTLKADARVGTAVAFLLKHVQPDGSVSSGDYPAYTTALTVLAMRALRMHADVVDKGQEWLARHQFSEATGTASDNANFGGIGYGSGGNADLSNLHFALEALRDTQLKNRPEVYARAVKFLERCQNRSESNDQPWASNDGGFVYRPGVSKAGGTLSSASMTYAGLKSFIYADVKLDDGRVQDALRWIRDNYGVDENPGLGQRGLYYYYHVMARALSLVGSAEIVDAKGIKHDWFAELSHKLMSLQRPDGSWKNPDATYWEDNAVIATSRALLALSFGGAKP